jgi:NarL family two-component system response regulator LiaR
MSQTPIRVLVVDDHRIVREGLQVLLAEIDDIEVVGEASNGIQSIDQAEQLRPDVILMDLEMPKMDGVEAIRRITAAQPDLRILVLTSFITDDKVFAAIKAGALGYLLKDSSSAELVESIHKVHRGDPALHPDIARKILAELGRAPSTGEPAVDPLTARELEVLGLVAQGLSNREIAEQLDISTETARTHVNRILSKLHVANRVQATLYALREGISSL